MNIKYDFLGDYVEFQTIGSFRGKIFNFRDSKATCNIH